MFTSYTKSDLQSQGNDTSNKPFETPENELVDKYQLEKCIKWIRENDYKVTCLQFPERLLNDGTCVAIYVQKVLEKVFYVLGDTSYGSCCVDEVAAEHVNADSIIHFGHACLSPVIKLPVFYVFEKGVLDLAKLNKSLEEFSNDMNVVIFFSDIYHHLHSLFQSLVEKRQNIQISRLTIDHKTVEGEKVICGRAFLNNEGSALYIGEESVTLLNLVLSLPGFKWYQYTDEGGLVEYHVNRNKFLMQRMHLVEKIKEAKVVGILIGTLGIKNYLDAANRIKSLVKKKGKKCYTMAVGKPNVAKLANFPEIDIFVYVACQENGLLKDFKDYYKPVVSLFEVEMALGERPYSVEYTSDFRELLPGGSFYHQIQTQDDANDTSQELMERTPGTVIEYGGGEFLSSRTWKGLEQNLGSTPITKAVKGRSGIPQSYDHELSTLSDETELASGFKF